MDTECFFHALLTDLRLIDQRLKLIYIDPAKYQDTNDKGNNQRDED